MNKKFLVVLTLIAVATAPAQQKNMGKEIPRDTSFTVDNTAAKVYEQYPLAKLVVSQIPPGVVANENIVYAKDGRRELHLDLFAPAAKNKKPYPAVVLIHGGGWRSGYRQMEWPMAQHLAAKEYVTATVEYRLSIEARYPVGIYDLKAAVRWLRANAGKYNIDPRKIAVYGCSAGGTLAAFLGTTGGLKRFEGSLGNGDQSSRVQAIIDVDGVVDFTDPAESGKDTDPQKPSAGKAWLGASYQEKPEIWREASPINYVDDMTPPVIFVNSALERYHAGRDQMIDKLNKLKIHSEVHTIPDTPHPFWLFHPWFDEAFEHILTFLNKTFKNG